MDAHGFEAEDDDADAHIAVLPQGQAQAPAMPVPVARPVVTGMTTRMHETVTDADGNEWIKHVPSRNGAKQYWRCRSHRSGCPVRGWSMAGSSVIEKYGNVEHTCNASPAAQQVRQMQSQIRARAFAEKNSSNAAIVDNITRGLNNDVAQRVKRQNLLRIANKAKSADGASKVNRLPADIEWTDAFVQTATGERFLLYDSRQAEPNQPIFFIWASPTGINQLRTHNNWASDGTFFAAPKHFDSLYTVHIVNDDHSAVCCAYILLPDRRKATYIRALRALIGEALLWDAAPASIMTDFEAAAIQAWREIFPYALTRGCYFHLGQAFWRSIASLGLTVLYRTNDTARTLLRSFLALAAVHPDQVLAAFNRLLAAIDTAFTNNEIDAMHREAIADFSAYVQDNYIRRMNREGQWIAPRVADIRAWNCFNAMLQGGHRTNNGTEAWNRQFGDMFTRSDCAMDKQELYPGEPLRRGRRPENVAADAALRDLAQRYVAVYGLERCLDYMRAVQYHLSKPRFPGEVDADDVDNFDDAGADHAFLQGGAGDDDGGALIQGVPDLLPMVQQGGRGAAQQGLHGAAQQGGHGAAQRGGRGAAQQGGHGAAHDGAAIGAPLRDAPAPPPAPVAEGQDNAEARRRRAQGATAVGAATPQPGRAQVAVAQPGRAQAAVAELGRALVAARDPVPFELPRRIVVEVRRSANNEPVTVQGHAQGVAAVQMPGPSHTATPLRTLASAAALQRRVFNARNQEPGAATAGPSTTRKRHAGAEPLAAPPKNQAMHREAPRDDAQQQEEVQLPSQLSQNAAASQPLGAIDNTSGSVAQRRAGRGSRMADFIRRLS